MPCGSGLLNIKAAKEAGVLLALGSDWLPTGTRNVLEELKVASAYVDKDPYQEGLSKIFTDEVSSNVFADVLSI